MTLTIIDAMQKRKNEIDKERKRIGQGLERSIPLTEYKGEKRLETLKEEDKIRLGSEGKKCRKRD